MFPSFTGTCWTETLSPNLTHVSLFNGANGSADTHLLLCNFTFLTFAELNLIQSSLRFQSVPSIAAYHLHSNVTTVSY